MFAEQFTTKIDLYELQANHSPSWYAKASALLKSAAHLVRTRDSILDAVPVALMLRAYAIENLCKALWIDSGERLANQGKFLNMPSGTSHDVLGMYQRLGYQADDIRANMLSTLTNAARHFGRYPIPNSIDAYSIRPAENPDPTAIWTTSYEKDFCTLVVELARALRFGKQVPSEFLEQEISAWIP